VPTVHGKRQVSYGFLCATPFIACGAAAAHPLRIPGVYHVIGGVLFAAISTAAWTLGARAIRADVESRRQLALAATAGFAVLKEAPSQAGDRPHSRSLH